MTKILIAEDERDIRDLIVFTLQFGGYEVVATTNGAEAAELAPSEKPDLILLDVRMPKMTGYEACTALKANPTTKDIPVIFLSAKGQESEVSTGLSAGAVAYILKPFSPDQLISKVKEALSKKEVREAPATPAPSPAPKEVPKAPAPTPAPTEALTAPTPAPAPKAAKPETEAKPSAAEAKPTPQPPAQAKVVKEEKKEEPKAATQASPTPIAREAKAAEQPEKAKDKEAEKPK